MHPSVRLSAVLATLLPIVGLIRPAAAGDDSLVSVAIEAAEAQVPAGGPRFPEALTLHARQVLDWSGGTNVRIEQRLLGLPVDGREIIVSLDGAGRPRRVKGQPAASVLLDPYPTLPATVAEQRSQALARAFFGARGAMWPPRSELAVFVGRDDAATLAWRVDVSTADPQGAWRMLIDAHTGAVLGVQNRLMEALGNVYPTNPVASTLTEVEVPRLDPAVDGMQGEYAYVNTCLEMDLDWGGSGCAEKTRLALADQGGDFLFEPDATEVEDPLAEVQMYYHLDRISDWFETEHGFAHPQPIEGLVNFDYNNAFFGNADADPYEEVAFGQGGGIDYAYDADVIYHEFGHSVFGSVAGQTGFLGADEYGMEWATGGINEGTADSFSLVLTGDPRVGDYAGAGFGSDAIRDLEEDRLCPDALYGESHKDGEVFGSFTWNVIDDELLGAEFAGDFFWGVVSGLPVNANWMALSESIGQTTADLLDEGLIDQGQADRVADLAAAHGLDACGRVIRLDEGQEPTQLMIAVRFAEDTPIPLGQQFSLDAPEGAYRLRFRVTEWNADDPNIAWTLFGRRGEFVRHEVTEIETPFGSVDLPVPEDYDFAIDGEGDDFELEMDLDSDPPLEPGATWYFSMASRRTGELDGFYVMAEITVEGEVDIEETPAEDDDDDDGEGGTACESCNSSLATRHGGAGVIGLLLAAALRRRRRG